MNKINTPSANNIIRSILITTFYRQNKATSSFDVSQYEMAHWSPGGEKGAAYVTHVLASFISTLRTSTKTKLMYSYHDNVLWTVLLMCYFFVEPEIKLKFTETSWVKKLWFK